MILLRHAPVALTLHCRRALDIPFQTQAFPEGIIESDVRLAHRIS